MYKILTITAITQSIVSLFECENRIRRDGNFFAQLSFQCDAIVSGNGRIRCWCIDWCWVGAIADFTTLTPSECIVATTVDRLTFAKAYANVALEADIVARREFECVETGQKAVRFRTILPFTEYTWIGGTTIFIRHNVLIFNAVFHGLGNATTCESTVNRCLLF